MYIQELQERINTKAEKIAKERWAQVEKNFPYWEEPIAFRVEGKDLKVDRYHFMQLIEPKVKARFVKEEINRISSEMMDAFEKVEELKNMLENQS